MSFTVFMNSPTDLSLGVKDWNSSICSVHLLFLVLMPSNELSRWDVCLHSKTEVLVRLLPNQGSLPCSRLRLLLEEAID